MNIPTLRSFTIILPILSTLLISSCTSAQTAHATTHEEGFKQWSKTFIEEAKHQGIGSSTLDAFEQELAFVPRAIELDRKQPDSTKTFNQYLDLVIPASRVNKARQKYLENKDLLNEIGEHYGVQPRFIVALWGIESDFGQNTGGFSILNTTATLAYEGRRAEFFKSELLNALKIIDQGHTSIDNMKGSWAGAMGQTQFMPSSFLELAVDYNKDGKKDIWTTKEDVFASIANYLSKRKWNPELTWGRQVTLPEGFSDQLIGKEIEKSLQTWNNLGIRKVDGSELPNHADLTASLIRPDQSSGKYYLIYDNYRTILNWNRSLYFATAVGLLSDTITN